MNSEYNEFLRRIAEYRTQLNITQEEASKAIGITQSQYSKMELGKTIFSYDVLHKLNKADWDTNYLLTGVESTEDDNELIEAIKAARPYEEEIFPIVVWLLLLGINHSNTTIDKDVKCEMEILRLRMIDEASHPLLYDIRKALELTQLAMAEKLGVNIKKYRLLEREVIRPDAELLIKIHEIAGCRPGVFLKSDNLMDVIINHLWHKISPSIRSKIMDCLKQTIQLTEV